MSTTSISAPTTFGQDLGEAEQAIRRQLNTILQQAAIAFETWVMMNLLSATAGADRTTLRDELATRLYIEPSAAEALLDRAARDGLIRSVADHTGGGRDHISLTGDGQTRYAALREEVGRTTAALLDGLAPDDIETTRRTLRAVNARARAMAAR